jgi:TPR repeat protein
MKKFLVILFLVIFFPAHAFADPLQTGRTFYQQQQYANAFKYLDPLAQSGNPEAEYLVGEMFLHGNGVNKNSVEAINWLQKASERGNVDATLDLGDIYSTGSDTSKDFQKAYLYYTLAYMYAPDGKGHGALAKRGQIESFVSQDQRAEVIKKAQFTYAGMSKEEQDSCCSFYLQHWKLFFAYELLAFVILNLVTITITNYVAELGLAIMFLLLGLHFVGSDNAHVTLSGWMFLCGSLFWAIFAHREKFGVKQTSAEAVEGRKYASSRRRFVASSIDGIILTIAGYFLKSAITNFITLEILNQSLSFIYYTWLEGSADRSSWGKRAMGIYVADIAGERISYCRAALRYLVLLLPSVPFILLPLVSNYGTFEELQENSGPHFVFDMYVFWWMFALALFYWLPMVFTKEKTGLHDYLTKTRVYRVASAISYLDRIRLSESDEVFVTKAQDVADLSHFAATGDSVSQYKLGKAYADGIGVKRDVAQAFTWCLKAAQQGYVDAQSTIGRMYFMGEGTSRNFEESYFWYSVAAKAGKPKEWPQAVARYLNPAQIEAVEKRVAYWNPYSTDGR